MKKRPFFLRKFCHWLYGLLQEEQEAQEIHDAARLWHRSVFPCLACTRPVPERSDFCPFCGSSQRQTSGMHRPVPLPQQYSPVTSVGSYVVRHRLPGERPALAYRRLRATIAGRKKQP